MAQELIFGDSIKEVRDLRGTYMSRGVDLRAGSQQPPDDVVVSHLRRDPQRCGAVRSRRVRLRPVLQEDFQNAEVAILGGDEQRRGTVLTSRNRFLTFSHTNVALLNACDKVTCPIEPC